MVRQHHQLNGHEFEQIPGDSGRQRNRVLQFMELQSVRHHLVTEQQQQQLTSELQFPYLLSGKHSRSPLTGC